MTRSRQSFGQLKARPNYLHMFVGIVTSTMLFFVYVSLHLVLNEQALISIALFNFLFVFLLLPLEGPLFRKVPFLVAGNLIGFAWHYMKSALEPSSIFYLGADTFKIITVIIGPIIDLVWIVSVWSLSLSVLASARKGNGGDEEKN